MHTIGNKKIVCLTGSVWTGSRAAPRRMLVKEGFVRPIWFTTSRRITDATYRRTSVSKFHLANARQRVLAYTRHGSSFVGILEDEFEKALEATKRGVLIVCPPEIAAQVAAKNHETTVFSLKEKSMRLSEHLRDVKRSGQLHRINVDVLEPGAWYKVHEEMRHKLVL